jgi:hypothetical protein
LKKFFLPGLIVLTSCLSSFDKNKGEVLARVYNEYLYAKDIRDIVPAGTSGRDSISMVKNFINTWVTEKLILHKAQKNLQKADLQFEDQLNEYRNSLIVYKYESQLIRQLLDTVVSNAEIEKFYYENIGNFLLKNNIVKVYYARFESSLPELKKIRTFFFSDIPEHRDSLEKYAQKFADLYYKDDETWILFDDVLRYIPITTYNQESYLQNHRKIEISQDQMVYLVNFTDIKIKDGESPLSFERENIRQIIINKRKLKIISQMRDDVFQSALKENNFEIF